MVGNTHISKDEKKAIIEQAINVELTFKCQLISSDDREIQIGSTTLVIKFYYPF